MKLCCRCCTLSAGEPEPGVSGKAAAEAQLCACELSPQHDTPDELRTWGRVEMGARNVWTPSQAVGLYSRRGEQVGDS